MISCVIPAYNEERRLGATIARVSEYFAAGGREYEIIVVDDGSRDATARLAAELAHLHPHCRLMSLGRNRGKGAAVRHGVAGSRGDLVLFSDADLSTPIEELEVLEKAILNGSDIAVGSRALPGSRIEVHQPRLRELMGKTYNLLIRVTLMSGIHDTQCGFKLFRGPVARELFGLARIDDFGFDVEILYLAGRRGFRITEVPVRWINSPASRVMVFSDSAGMLYDLLRVRAWSLLGKYRADV
ncbi:MAG: glycosyltransferase family 2 protein [Acidobacteria bacterium]|nr:glycosyltransferase family 2 protein [Acidobacteriota bacterium]